MSTKLSLGHLERIFEAAKKCEKNLVDSQETHELHNVSNRLFKDFVKAAEKELGTDGMLFSEVEALVYSPINDETKYAVVDKNECRAVIICASALYARFKMLP